MKEKLKIYVERIRDNSEEIEETLAPTFMEVNENELTFEKPVTLSGEAYVTDDYLIATLTIKTEVELVCAVCNEPFVFEVEIDNMMHEEPLETIKDGTFDLLPVVRENILLAIPFYPQCGITECKNRDSIEPYLKKGGTPAPENNPFKDLL